MNKTIYIYILAIVIILSGCKSTSKTSIQQENYQTQSVNNYISVITSNYTDWKEVGISGKISMDRLPINPTAKIYMKKGDEIIVSLRVPLLGEVGRVEIDKKYVCVFNKLKNVYVKEDVENLFNSFDLSVDNLQDMLLARIFILGEGTLSKKHNKLIEIQEYESEPGILYVLPKDMPEEFNYAFRTNSNGILSMMVFDASSNMNTEAYLKYSPKEEGYSINANLDFRGKNLTANLSYSSIDWNPTKTERLSIGKNWEKVNITDFLKSF